MYSQAVGVALLVETDEPLARMATICAVCRPAESGTIMVISTDLVDELLYSMVILQRSRR